MSPVLVSYVMSARVNFANDKERWLLYLTHLLHNVIATAQVMTDAIMWWSVI